MTDPTPTKNLYAERIAGVHASDLPTLAEGAQQQLQLDDRGRLITAAWAWSRAINAPFTVLTRPANATPYTTNDSISNNATAGSVTALVATVADVNDAPLIMTHVALDTNDTGLGGKTVVAYVYRSDPTLNSGVGGGDNAAFSNKRAGLVGVFIGTMRAMSDGAYGILTPVLEAGINHYVCAPESGGKRLWVQYQTGSDFTPSANSTTLSGRIKGFQGRA